MLILGLNAYHGDSSACILKNGLLIAAAEEERFNRIKHWSGFPKESVEYCLKEGKVSIDDIDYVALNRNPKAHILKRISFVLRKRPSPSLVFDRMKNAGRWQNIGEDFLKVFNKKSFKPKVYHVEHHLAHLASSFFVSPFTESALISVDGSGDFVSTMTAVGQNNRIKVFDTVYFPHSLGILYQAITQYLGFLKYGDEYKVMGLAPYGRPVYLKEIEEIVSLKDDSTFELNLKYFSHHEKLAEYNWDNAAPSPDILYTEELINLLGSQRNAEDQITQKHKDISRSLQITYENILFHLLNALFQKTNDTNLCISGGCGMNSVANGKVFKNTPFKKAYISANAGDGGGSIGAAYYFYNELLKNDREEIMDHAFWGPSYSDSEIQKVLNNNRKGIEKENCIIKKLANLSEIAFYITEGKVVGWFQGRMEWGPRALGNRSILCDARRYDMKDILNRKIKRRESFRPFAPSILREYVNEYFEIDSDVPFMSQVFQIKEDKRSLIPAVTHVDGSGRLQTVARKQNQLYYDLIEEVRKITGVPIVLNTSFNENEPIVNTPQEALNCFLRTNMDVLVLNNIIVLREKNT